MTGRVCIIVPCYNEEERLEPGRFADFVREAPDFDLCFVNDGSTDATGDVLRSLSDGSGGKIRSLTLAENAGKAEAVRQGVASALSQGVYDIVGYMDADLSAPTDEMRRLAGILSRNENISAVIGSRRRLPGSEIRRKAFRHYPGRIFAQMVRATFGLKIYDTQCGAKVFDATLAEKIFAMPFISRWIFDIELLLRIKLLEGYGVEAVEEVPLRTWVDGGNSRIKPSDLMRIPAELYKIKRKYFVEI